MKEVWKDIKGFEGRYQVSNFGNVMSLNYNKTGKKRLLKPSKHYKNGYLLVGLHKDGKVKMYLVHRLVAQAFLENPHKYKEINHLDECKTNNAINNLEWCDRKYNCNYGTRTERTCRAIIAIDYTSGLIEEFPSAWEASRQLGIAQSNIVACLKGRCKTYKGFYWFYSSQDTNSNSNE